MTAAASMLPTFSGLLDDHALEDWFGPKLRMVWAGVVAEPLPPSFHAAVAVLGHSHSSRALHPTQAHRSDVWHGEWSLWLQRLLCKTGRAQAVKHPKMMERAIRKQGVAWLVADSQDWMQ
jgi:hypothetical protein